jgi:Glycogen recognition site of AMP-activated protein kinase
LSKFSGNYFAKSFSGDTLHSRVRKSELHPHQEVCAFCFLQTIILSLYILYKMSLTPTKFTWVSGPGSVKVKGDWDSWKEEIELNKKEDGSFERQIPLPENKRVHFKYIVDGNWVTKESDPTVNDDGNVNNTIDVGPAPKAEKLSEGVTAAAAGVSAAAAGAGAAAVAAVKGSENGQSASATQSSTDKKAAPAQPVKEVANADIRSEY